MSGEVRSFESMDDMIAYMRDQTGKANAGLAPEQASLRPGCYWVQFAYAEDVAIFGHSFTTDLYVSSELDATDESESVELYGSHQAHADHLRKEHANDWANGYMFGRAYSIYEPKGELGSTHKASVWPISPATFAAAGGANWSTERLHEVARAGVPDARAALVELHNAEVAYRTHYGYGDGES